MSSAPSPSSTLPTGNAPIFIVAGGEKGSKPSLPYHFLAKFFSFDFKTFINSQILGGFLLSKNKQANMAQGPNACHEVLHYGLRPLSPILSQLFQIFKDCRKAGSSGEHLAQQTNHSIISVEKYLVITESRFFINGCLKH